MILLSQFRSLCEKKHIVFFDGSLKYQLPVSGENKKSTIHELRDLSISRSLEAINNIEIDGLSMNMGEVGVKTSDAKFFAENLINLK